jgi:hypothetical protein
VNALLELNERRTQIGQERGTHSNVRGVQVPLIALACSQKASGVGKRCRGVKDGSSSGLDTLKNAIARPTFSVLIEHGTPFILVYIEGVKRRLILDTSSGVSLLQHGISKVEMGRTDMKPKGGTGETLDIKGQQSVFYC